MNYSVYRFTLDLHQTKSQYCIQIPQYSTAIQFVITLNDGGKPYIIAEDCEVKLNGKKANARVFLHDCQTDGTRIVYTFNGQTASQLGIVDCEVVLYGADTTPLTLISPKFQLLVTERAVNDDDVEETEPGFSSLDKIFTSEQERQEAEEQRKANEAERIEAEKQREAVFGDLDAALDAILKIQEGLIGGTLEYELGTSNNGDPYYIVKGIGTYKYSHLVIPDTYEGVVVSEIAENAFRGNTKLTSAVIGKNILEIGKFAFEGCSNLTSIQLTRERIEYDSNANNPESGEWWVEECYGQTDVGVVPRLASDTDAEYVAQLLTTTEDFANNGDYLSTDAWYWMALPI